MTYKALLDKLLNDCIQKGSTYRIAAGAPGYSYSHVAGLKREWLQAEDDYEACLHLIISKEINPNDIITEVLASMVLPAGVTFQQSSYVLGI